MKLTRNAQIEPCCEWSREIKKFRVSIKTDTPRFSFEGSWDNRVKLKADMLPSFCPNCGAKTQLKEVEK